MKNVRNQIVLLACFFALSSCDKVTTTIDAGSVSIQLDDITVGDDGSVKSFAITKSAGEALNPFHVQQTLSMDMLAGLSSEAKEYQSKISKVEIGTETSIIITTDGSGTVVEDFKIEAAGVKTLSVPEYRFGTPYTGDIEEFATQLLMKLFSSGSAGVPITISGKTDVDSDKTLQVKITLSDVSLVAKVLK